MPAIRVVSVVRNKLVEHGCPPAISSIIEDCSGQFADISNRPVPNQRAGHTSEVRNQKRDAARLSPTRRLPTETARVVGTGGTPR